MGEIAQNNEIPYAVVGCSACQNIYLKGGKRENCPLCGGPPGATILSLEEEVQGEPGEVEGPGETGGEVTELPPEP